MDVDEAIHTQRAVRTFTSDPISADVLERIVEAGRLAPSSNNEQRWAFIIVTDHEQLNALSKVGDWADHLAGAAAGIALVTPDVEVGWERESIACDLGQASQSMMLAAWAHGIGSVHAAVYDEAQTRALLGYPDDHRCDYLISFGYPADPSSLSKPRSLDARKPAEQTVHRERW